MGDMNDSMAQRDHALMPLELHGWRTGVNWLAAILVSLLFWSPASGRSPTQPAPRFVWRKPKCPKT